MFAIVFIAVFAYVISKITKVDTKNSIIDAIIKETHKYSGIDETLYKTFIANMSLAKDYKNRVKLSQTYLQKALHRLNEIPLYMTPIDADILDDVAEISSRLGAEFEHILLEEANNQNIEFKPKYI